MIPFPAFHAGTGWHFYADGRLYGPYATLAAAEQRREDYAAYRTTSGTTPVTCHCRAVAQ